MGEHFRDDSGVVGARVKRLWLPGGQSARRLRHQTANCKFGKPPHFELGQGCHDGALELPALNRSSWLKIRGSDI
jgi:hypothetical protein